MPTRNGRNGQIFTKQGVMNMRNEKWKNDFSPIEEDGASYVDTLYSKAYLRHLINSNEILGLQIASIRSEEHTSELQSRPHLVCRLLLEKKKNKIKEKITIYNT